MSPSYSVWNSQLRAATWRSMAPRSGSRWQPQVSQSCIVEKRAEHSGRSCVQQYLYSDTLYAVRFLVNPAVGQPLYLQLVQQVRHAIETGVLQPGDGLPALRVLAQDLVVSPNTVVK